MVLGSSAVTRVRVALARYVSLSRKPVGATRARTQTNRHAACYLCLTGPQNPPFVWSVTPNLVEPPPSPSPSPYPLLKLGLRGRSPLTLTFSEVRSQSQRDADLASFPQTFIHNSDVAPIRGKTSVKAKLWWRPGALWSNSVCWPKRSFCSHLRMRVKHHTGVKGIHILYLSKSMNTYVKTNWSKSNWFNFFT